jgi:hypothetical protein
MPPRLIRREEWLATFPDPAPKDRTGRPIDQWRPNSFAAYVDGEVKGQTIHWPGGNRYQIGVRDPFAHLRSMQHDYRIGRDNPTTAKYEGYDLGYNYVVSARPGEQFGWIFEARGLYRSAAQNEPGDAEDENAENVAVQLVVSLDGYVDPSQINAVRWLVEHVLWPRWPRARRQLGHRDVDRRTACPGDRIWRMVHDGIFLPQSTPASGTVRDMVIVRHKTPSGVEEAVMVQGGQVQVIQGEKNVANAAAAGVPTFYVDDVGWLQVNNFQNIA